MSIEDLLTWMNRRLICGTVTIESAPIVRTFVLDSGYIISASSNDPKEELGQRLLDAGLVDATALAEAKQVHADTGVALSRILTMVGKVDEGRLLAVMEDSARDAVFEVFTWVDGTFAVDRTSETPPVVGMAIAVQLRVCIEEGRQWARRWKADRECIPSDDLVLEITKLDAIKNREDSIVEQRQFEDLAREVQRGLSVGAIINAQRRPRFRVLNHLAEMVRRGGVQVVARAPSRAAPSADKPASAVDTLAEEAKRRAAVGDRTTALELVQRALALDTDNDAVQALCRDIERALFAELSRDLLASFRVPKLLVERAELDRLELSDNERYLAGRIDGHWDLLSLMRVSPLREVEALITFKRLADRGIISL